MLYYDVFYSLILLLIFFFIRRFDVEVYLMVMNFLFKVFVKKLMNEEEM